MGSFSSEEAQMVAQPKTRQRKTDKTGGGQCCVDL
eukprot:COSAG04_NODE_4870_length_1851_cov_1.716324_1_plen_34_part_10